MSLFEAWCLAGVVVFSLDEAHGGSAWLFLVLSIPFWLVEWLSR